MLNDLRVSQLEIDPELGRTPAEFSFLGTCDDIIGKLRRGRRYDIIRASGLLRHLFIDGEALIDAANRRFRLKLTFHNSMVNSDENSKIVNDAMEILKKYDSIVWIAPLAGMHDKTRPRLSKEQFLKTPVTYHSGNPTLSVRDIIETIAHVYGGVHNGTPKNEQNKLIIALDDSIQIGGGEPSLAAIYGICIVALDGLTPLIEAILVDGKNN
ncbi:MAG: hypothetical protein PHY62_06030 [Gallionella sp.]|nr:hypothetical protein [Gallionella sp.]